MKHKILAYLYLLLGQPEWFWPYVTNQGANIAREYLARTQPGYREVMMNDKPEFPSYVGSDGEEQK